MNGNGKSVFITLGLIIGFLAFEGWRMDQEATQPPKPPFAITQTEGGDVVVVHSEKALDVVEEVVISTNDVIKNRDNKDAEMENIEEGTNLIHDLWTSAMDTVQMALVVIGMAVLGLGIPYIFVRYG